MLRTADELRAELLAKKQKREQEQFEKEKLLIQAKAAVADLVFLGMSFKEILQRTSIAPETLAKLFKELRLPYRMPSKIYENPRASPTPVYVPKLPMQKFGADRWSHAMVLDISDSEDESDDPNSKSQTSASESSNAMKIDSDVASVPSGSEPLKRDVLESQCLNTTNQVLDPKPITTEPRKHNMTADELIQDMDRRIDLVRQRERSAGPLATYQLQLTELDNKRQNLQNRLESFRNLKQEAEEIHSEMNRLRERLTSVTKLISAGEGHASACSRELSNILQAQMRLASDERRYIIDNYMEELRPHLDIPEDEALPDYDLSEGKSDHKSKSITTTDSQENAEVTEQEGRVRDGTEVSSPDPRSSESHVIAPENPLVVQETEAKTSPALDEGGENLPERIQEEKSDLIEGKTDGQPADANHNSDIIDLTGATDDEEEAGTVLAPEEGDSVIDKTIIPQQKPEEFVAKLDKKLEDNPPDVDSMESVNRAPKRKQTEPELVPAKKPSNDYKYESPLHIFTSHRFSPFANVFAPMYNSRWVDTSAFFCKNEAAGCPCRTPKCGDVHANSFERSKSQVLKSLTQAPIGDTKEFAKGLTLKISALQKISDQADPAEAAKVILDYRNGLDPGRFLDWHEFESSK